MSILDTIIGTVPGAQLSLGELLKTLRLRGRLRSLIVDALTERMVQKEALQAELSVTQKELQSAADAFRRHHGLSAAADTDAWLSARGMSVNDLMASLEHDLLAVKLRHHLTDARVEGHFAAHRTDYERLRLAQLCVGRDDLANELASQIREDGRDIDAVAGEHRIPLVRGEWFRKELAIPLAEALGSAGAGQLVGPVLAPQGFLLGLVEAREPAKLDAAARQHIENELFTAWVAERMSAVEIDLELTGTL